MARLDDSSFQFSSDTMRNANPFNFKTQSGGRFNVSGALKKKFSQLLSPEAQLAMQQAIEDSQSVEINTPPESIERPTEVTPRKVTCFADEVEAREKNAKLQKGTKKDTKDKFQPKESADKDIKTEVDTTNLKDDKQEVVPSPEVTEHTADDTSPVSDDVSSSQSNTQTAEPNPLTESSKIDKPEDISKADSNETTDQPKSRLHETNEPANETGTPDESNQEIKIGNDKNVEEESTKPEVSNIDNTNKGEIQQLETVPESTSDDNKVSQLLDSDNKEAGVTSENDHVSTE